MIPAFEFECVPSNDATFTVATKFSGAPSSRKTAPNWFVACHRSAPAAVTVKLLPSWSKAGSGWLSGMLENVCHGGRTPNVPTVKRTRRESVLRPLLLVATAWTT
jgi:hypothetical protein